MGLRIIAVGKRHDPALTAAIEDYSTRLKSFAKVEWVIVPSVSGKNKDQQIEQESEALLNRIKPQEYVVLLDERGTAMTNPQLAQKFEGVLSGGQSSMVFVIGGAYGVSETLQQRASFTWSLSPLVFPHQLVRLILAEQLYRTFSFIQGHPYHHE